MHLGPFNKYPGTDYETYNWEWILKTVKEWDATMQTFKDTITAAWDAMRDDWQEFIDRTYKDQITEILEDHPEWVTTVMDGAITENKIYAPFLRRILNCYVTPEMFGAVGDGVADDTTAVQACIANGNIIIAKNTYKITAPLNFNNIKNLRLTGGGTITKETDTTHNVIDGNRAKHIRIDGITFEGNGNDRTMTYTWRNNIQAAIILASQSKFISVDDCVFKNFNYGVFILGADEPTGDLVDAASINGKITNNMFINVNHPIDCYGKSLKIDGNTIFDCTDNAIQIETGGTDDGADDPLTDTGLETMTINAVISKNTIINTAQNGIVVFENSRGVMIEDNTIIGFRYGITNIRKARGVIIKNNYISSDTNTGVNSDWRPWNDERYGYGIGYGGDCICEGNFIENVAVGINIRGGGLCDGNYIRKPRISGITTQRGSLFAGMKNVIANNKITDHTLNQSAFWASRAITCAADTLNVIINNVIESTVQPMYQQSGAYSTVINLISNIAETDTIAPIADEYIYSNN